VSPEGVQREARDAELASAGWMRRFVGAPPRLDEVTEIYEGLGLEVLLDDLSPAELRAECNGCVLALSLFRVVYTRPDPAREQPVHEQPSGDPG